MENSHTSRGNDNHKNGHSHGQHQHGTNNKNALGWSLAIISIYMVVEVIGGIYTNSLALLSDAGHMLSDAAALGLSYLAMKFGEKRATLTKTYGFKRFEILAAFLNGITLVVISLYIFFEAFRRFSNPPEIISSGMLIIATIGLIVNIIAALILMKGDRKENLNIRSAFLHVIGDMMGSLGAIIAALLIMFFGWSLADPIASIIVAILIIISGWRITKDSYHILMEGTPTNLDVLEIKEAMLGINQVKKIHDLHVWSITSGFPALSCHLIVESQADHDLILKEANQILQNQFNIEHSTIQVDKNDLSCMEKNRYH